MKVLDAHCYKDEHRRRRLTEAQIRLTVALVGYSPSIAARMIQRALDGPTRFVLYTHWRRLQAVQP